jgi:hypothetical protein
MIRKNCEIGIEADGTMPVHDLRVHGLSAKSRRDSGVNAARLNAFPIWA